MLPPAPSQNLLSVLELVEPSFHADQMGSTCLKPIPQLLVLEV